MNFKHIFSANMSHATVAVFLFSKSGNLSDNRWFFFLMPFCFIRIWVFKFGFEVLRLNCSSREREKHGYPRESWQMSATKRRRRQEVGRGLRGMEKGHKEGAFMKFYAIFLRYKIIFLILYKCFSKIDISH